MGLMDLRRRDSLRAPRRYEDEGFEKPEPPPPPPPRQPRGRMPACARPAFPPPYIDFKPNQRAAAFPTLDNPLPTFQNVNQPKKRGRPPKTQKQDARDATAQSEKGETGGPRDSNTHHDDIARNEDVNDSASSSLSRSNSSATTNTSVSDGRLVDTATYWKSLKDISDAFTDPDIMDWGSDDEEEPRQLPALEGRVEWKDLTPTLQAEIVENLGRLKTWPTIARVLRLTNEEQMEVIRHSKLRTHQIREENKELKLMQEKQLRALMMLDNTDLQQFDPPLQIVLRNATKQCIRGIKNLTASNDYLMSKASDVLAARKFLKSIDLDPKYAGEWENNLVTLKTSGQSLDGETLEWVPRPPPPGPDGTVPLSPKTKRRKDITRSNVQFVNELGDGGAIPQLNAAQHILRRQKEKPITKARQAKQRAARQNTPNQNESQEPFLSLNVGPEGAAKISNDLASGSSPLRLTQEFEQTPFSQAPMRPAPAPAPPSSQVPSAFIADRHIPHQSVRSSRVWEGISSPSQLPHLATESSHTIANSEEPLQRVLTGTWWYNPESPSVSSFMRYQQMLFAVKRYRDRDLQRENNLQQMSSRDANQLAPQVAHMSQPPQQNPQPEPSNPAPANELQQVSLGDTNQLSPQDVHMPQPIHQQNPPPEPSNPMPVNLANRKSDVDQRNHADVQMSGEMSYQWQQPQSMRSFKPVTQTELSEAPTNTTLQSGLTVNVSTPDGRTHTDENEIPRPSWSPITPPSTNIRGIYGATEAEGTEMKEDAGDPMDIDVRSSEPELTTEPDTATTRSEGESMATSVCDEQHLGVIAPVGKNADPTVVSVNRGEHFAAKDSAANETELKTNVCNEQLLAPNNPVAHDVLNMTNINNDQFVDATAPVASMIDPSVTNGNDQLLEATAPVPNATSLGMTISSEQLTETAALVVNNADLGITNGNNDQSLATTTPVVNDPDLKMADASNDQFPVATPAPVVNDADLGMTNVSNNQFLVAPVDHAAYEPPSSQPETLPELSACGTPESMIMLESEVRESDSVARIAMHDDVHAKGEAEYDGQAGSPLPSIEVVEVDQKSKNQKAQKKKPARRSSVITSGISVMPRRSERLNAGRVLRSRTITPSSK